MKKQFLYFLFLLLISPNYTYAATITLKGKREFTTSTSSRNTIHFVQTLKLDGEIKNGDSKKIRQIVKKIDAASPFQFHILLLLNSKGGSFQEALKLSTYIRSRGIGTLIQNKDTCLSACAVAFMAGTLFEDGSDALPISFRYINIGAKLGFHRPSLRLNSEGMSGIGNKIKDRLIEDAYAAASIQMGTFFDELKKNKVATSLGIEMLKSGSDFLMIDTIDKAGRWGISISGISFPSYIGPFQAAIACSNINRWRSDFFVNDNNTQFPVILPSIYSTGEILVRQSKEVQANRKSKFSYMFQPVFQGQSCGFTKHKNDNDFVSYSVEIYEGQIEIGASSQGEFTVHPIHFFSPKTKIINLPTK